MTCQTIQNRVLALPDPRQLPDHLRDHVEACPACMTWWKQAVRLERLLEQLPAPPAPADKKAVLLDDLTSAGPVIKSIPAVERGPRRSLFTEFWALPGTKYLAGLAAAVLILIGGWMMMRPGPGTAVAAREAPRDPLLEKMAQRIVGLAHAKTPDQQLEGLSRMADDLSAGTRTFAKVATEEELRDLAGLFKTVVSDGIVTQAAGIPPHALTPTQKKVLLEKLAARLAETEQQAERAARESPPHAQPALKTIADTARDGQVKLKALVGA